MLATALLPWWGITYRVRNLSSASYLNIARLRSALELQNRVLRARADLEDFHDFHILGCLMTISSPPDKWYLKLFNLNETSSQPRSGIISDGREVS